MKKVFILMPVYNRLEYTKRCLRSIRRQRYKNFQTIVIDSNSDDGTVEEIRKYFPEVKIIQGTKDWWWTRAIDEGARLALKSAKRGDYVLEMNNDCFLGPNYLEQLLKTAKKYPKSIIGSLCVRANKPNEVVESGVKIDWPTGMIYGVAQIISNKFSYYKKMEVVGELDALPGKGTLIPIEVYKKIGGYEVKRLPHYIADYEFTNRAKRNGYELLVDTKAILKHHHQATGVSSKDNRRMKGYKEAWNLMFGRKSMNNIADWINFILLACPKKYRWRNYYYTMLRAINGVLFVFPFFYLRPIIVFFVRSGLKVYYGTKLLLYRARLYVTQFREYHLKRGGEK